LNHTWEGGDHLVAAPSQIKLKVLARPRLSELGELGLKLGLRL
jgi:hypothetical protein